MCLCEKNKLLEESADFYQLLHMKFTVKLFDAFFFSLPFEV